ncbi:hypothetical protein [Bacillus sp. FJAT-49711]|uniref:hypothetical protein n=1 Tax=Bacillus sp. FJAT-49711 TaxID=2833585 RepID=UPI0020168EE8|nr:hypothetical protein [Bacillus sp. FJAT-49711]
MGQNWPNNNPNFMQLGDVEENIITISGNSNLQEEFLNYALKFKESSYLITDNILEVSDISKLDNYFFSLAYLYRHSLELILKAIGFKYITALEDRKLFVKETFHNLSRILEFISPHIESCIEKNKDAYDWLVLLFEDMNQIDKNYSHLGKSKKGHGNFISYAERAQKIFDEDSNTVNLMETQVKKHWKNIQSRLDKPE